MYALCLLRSDHLILIPRTYGFTAGLTWGLQTLAWQELLTPRQLVLLYTVEYIHLPPNHSLQTNLLHNIPSTMTTAYSLQEILAAKSQHGQTFSSLALLLPNRNEVSTASLLLSRHPPPSPEEIKILSSVLQLDGGMLAEYFSSTPDRGETALQMPPREPLIYRLYEAVMNYGKAYKAVMNEMFGDGIMSAIAFKTDVGKEIVLDPETGIESTWVVITMKGKW